MLHLSRQGQVCRMGKLPLFTPAPRCLLASGIYPCHQRPIEEEACPVLPALMQHRGLGSAPRPPCSSPAPYLCV